MISVIITTYNSEKTIERCVESVKSQNIKTHIIVIDDCSDDATVDVCRKIGVIVLQLKRHTGGPTQSRNLGLEHVLTLDCTHFCHLDADDVLMPGALNDLQSLGTDIAFGRYALDGDNRQWDGKVKYYYDNEFFLSVLAQEKKKFPMPYVSGILFKSGLANVKWNENFTMVDRDHMLRISEGRTSAFINRPIITKNFTGDNISFKEDYRIKQYWFTCGLLAPYYSKYPKETMLGIERLAGTIARYYYFHNNMTMARFYFIKADISIKNILYFITSYVGCGIVKKLFKKRIMCV